MDDEQTRPGSSFSFGKAYPTTFASKPEHASPSSLFSVIFCRPHQQFFWNSTNPMVTYHRDVVLAAMVPIIYDILIWMPALHPDIGSRYIHAVTVVSLLVLLYAVVVVWRGLVPRSKTYVLWNAYMDVTHPRLNEHVKEVLLAYYRQTVRGAESHLDMLRSSILAFETYHVRNKYVNFCWKFAYRLWVKEQQIHSQLERLYKDKLLHSRTQLPRSGWSEPTALQPAVSIHGDVMDQPTSRGKDVDKLSAADKDDVGFRVLKNLTQRVNRFAGERTNQCPTLNTSH
ncbi:uncharacterized protein LOC129593368 [Paramacrobiotus metropolitanus]|uniref:uncharacterized protein LOC129593368 n=1 Tax=Paramacrobiotus metropolitanus TaxID=2943436 RepID=UPI0024465458|nr:uncharacterized protein LOC129593368 [Paramacrobiotus metropolitanus]